MHEDRTFHTRGPAEVITSIPHFLGFYPEESLVLVVITHDRRANLPRIAFWLRSDLAELSTPEIATYLVDVIRRNGGIGAIPVVVSQDAERHHHLVEALTRSMRSAGIVMRETLSVPAIERGAVYKVDGVSAGTLPDPASTVLAATLVSLGEPLALANREEALRLVSTDDRSAILPAIAQALVRMREDADKDPKKRVRLVLDALQAFDQGRLPSDAEIADLAVTVTIPGIRDEVMGEYLASMHQVRVAVMFFRHLVQATPAPFRAYSAVLLAVFAYLSGNGALAGEALDLANETPAMENPEDDHCKLVGVLTAIMGHVVPPGELRQVLLDEFDDHRRS